MSRCSAQDFQALKDVGNEYYTSRDFARAAEVYSSIIDDSCRGAGVIPMDLVRTALANRAASYLELGHYHKAIDDCTTILTKLPLVPDTPDQFKQKIYYRLARGYYHVGRYDDALTHLDAYRDLHGSIATDASLRVLILEAQVKQNQLATANGTVQVFEYTVHLLGTSELQHPPLIFYGHALPELCVPQPPETQCKAFLANLVKEHHDDIMGMKPWGCWKCPKQAVSILHNPMSWLHLAEPKVIDFALPICQNRGKCDAEGRKFIQDEMALLQTARGLLGHPVN